MPEKPFVKRARVAVLLATYNGERFLKEQLDSIFAQTYSNILVYARDDCSVDCSRDILDNYAKKYPEHLVVLPRGERLGARGSFSCLMGFCDADYIFFCDQDDLWVPNKIESGLRALVELESINGTNIPALIHSDLKVVNENLQVIHDSFWRYQHLNPDNGTTLNRLLVQNYVTGCTMGINRALSQLAFPVPEAAVMHDWWIALVAASFGVIRHLDAQTILYRQHGRNEKGAKAWTFGFVFGTFIRNMNASGDIVESLRFSRDQAAAFHRRYSDRLDPVLERMVHAYAYLDEYNILQRRMVLLKYRLLKSGTMRNLGLMLFT